MGSNCNFIIPCSIWRGIKHIQLGNLKRFYVSVLVTVKISETNNSIQITYLDDIQIRKNFRVLIFLYLPIVVKYLRYICQFIILHHVSHVFCNIT